MNYLRDLAMHSFVLIRAGWTVEKALALLNHFPAATHVIMHRTEPDVYQHLSEGSGTTGAVPVSASEVKDYYYLYTVTEARNIFEHSAPRDSVRNALGLKEYMATPVSDAYSDAAAAPARSIVMDEGRLVGFVDANVPPPGPIRRERKGLETSEPVPRSLKADFPAQVQLQQTVSLMVTLSPEIATAQAAPGVVQLVLKKGTTLDIIVQPRRGFALADSGEASLIVSEGEDQHLFKVTAVELGVGEIRVFAFQEGQRLGTIILKPLVVPEPLVVADTSVRSDRVIQSHDIIPITSSEPDLTFLILEKTKNGGPSTFTYLLNAKDPNLKLHFNNFGPKTLKYDPEDYFNDFFDGIEKLSLQTPNERMVAQKKMEAKGIDLFKAVIPDDLQTLLWSLRDQIKTVEVDSAEPWIPWELCKLQGKQDGKVINGPFFCEAFTMTRWLQEVGLRPALTLKNMAFVVPKDSGLPFAANERDYLLSLATGGRQVKRIQATYMEVVESLSMGEYDGWHFTGHGGFRPLPNNSVMLLENSEQFTPTDLNNAPNLGLAKPLVFLNACQIGRAAMSLTDIGGWAKSFLTAGAGAFIGAYWSIYDQAANDFAQAFYNNFLGGMEIGKAVQEARLKIKPLGDPTWLAYTVYAHPLAKVV